VDRHITCWVAVGVSKMDEKAKLTAKINFSAEVVPICDFTPRGTSCQPSNQTAMVQFENGYVRTVVLSFKKRIQAEPTSWVEENIRLIIIVAIPSLGALIGMGIGVWYMFCRTKANRADLERIIQHEKKQMKQKRDLTNRDDDESSTTMEIEREDYSTSESFESDEVKERLLQ
jgi:hypothetical protein